MKNIDWSDMKEVKRFLLDDTMSFVEKQKMFGENAPMDIALYITDDSGFLRDYGRSLYDEIKDKDWDIAKIELIDTLKIVNDTSTFLDYVSFADGLFEDPQYVYVLDDVPGGDFLRNNPDFIESVYKGCLEHYYDPDDYFNYILGDELKDDYEYMLNMMLYYQDINFYAYSNFTDDERFTMDAVEIEQEALEYSSLNDNKDFILKLLKKNGIYKADSVEKVDDNTVAIGLVKTVDTYSLYLLDYISDKLKHDYEFIKEVVKLSPEAIDYFPKDVRDKILSSKESLTDKLNSINKTNNTNITIERNEKDEER